MILLDEQMVGNSVSFWIQVGSNVFVYTEGFDESGIRTEFFLDALDDDTYDEEKLIEEVQAFLEAPIICSGNRVVPETIPVKPLDTLDVVLGVPNYILAFSA